MTLDEFVSLFRDAVEFPRLMVMEYIDGPEHTVDALVEDGRILLHQVKTRERIDAGLAMSFSTVDRPDLVEAAPRVCEALQLDWFVNIQFKGDRLLEVNPRVSTFVFQEDFDLPYLGIKRALGELDDDELPALAAPRPDVAAHGPLLRPGLLGRGSTTDAGLYFHQYFATRSRATPTRSYELARRLVERGHQVTIVSRDTRALELDRDDRRRGPDRP